MTRQNNVYYLVFAGIFLVPLFGMLPFGLNIWYSQMIALIALFFIGVSVSVWRWNKWIALLNLSMTYSTLVTANQGLRSLFFLFIFNLAVLTSFMVSKFNAKQRRILVEGVLVLVFIQFLWIVLQYFNRDFIFDAGHDKTLDDTVGFSGSHNQIGLFFAITSAVSYYFFPPLVVLNIVGVWLSTTSSAFIGMVGGLIVCARCLHRKSWTLLCVAVVLCSAVFFTRFENSVSKPMTERLGLIKHSVKEVISGKALMRTPDGLLRLVESRPFEGFGLGNFISISPFTQWQFLDVGERSSWPEHRYEHMHNDYFEIFYEMGLAGLLFTLMIVVDFLVSFARASKTPLLVVSFCCIFSQLISACGIYTVYTAVSSMLLIIFYGIYRGELDGQKACTS